MLSVPDAALARHDPALPALATLLDPDAFRDALAASSPGSVVEAVEPLYVRYKPGTSCLVAYRLSSNGSERHAHATTFASGSAAKLDKARSRSEGIVVLEPEAAVVRFFPHDRRLPAVRQVADPGARPQLLRKLLPERPDLWDAEVDELNYKPERRYVARLDGGGARALLKVYGGPDYMLARAAARGRTASGGLHVASVIGRSTSKRIIVLEWLDGSPLDELVLLGAAQPRLLRRVGAALAELHARDTTELPAASSHDSLVAAADALAAICPDLVGRAGRLSATLCEELLQHSAEGVAIHGDFSADQVVVSETCVGVLDLDNAARGDPAADLGSFAAQLERAALAGELPRGRAHELAAELIEGYRTAGVRGVPSRALELHTAAALLRLTAEPFRYREPAWDERAADLLERAEQFAGAGSRRRSTHDSGVGSILERLASLPAEGGICELQRAWPRRPGHLLLEYAGPGGSVVGAQWLADGAELARMARATPSADGSPPLVEANGARVLVHLGGADRRLPGLAPIAAQPGATLLVHRPERRAVVRLEASGDVRYAKVVRPERVGEIAAAGSAAHRLADGFAAPALLHLDAPAGVMIWSGLEGESLYTLAGRDGFVSAARAAGRALRALHAALPPRDAAHYGGAEEAHSLEAWLERVAAFVPAVHDAAAAASGPVLAALAQSPAPAVLCHRDFFDKQVVVDGAGRVGVLDFDTLAIGEAALDVANALVHFELRTIQGRCLPERAAAAGAAFLEAYEPGAAVRRRLGAYADATRLRLACLYAFRPRSEAVPAALLRLIGGPPVADAAESQAAFAAFG